MGDRTKIDYLDATWNPIVGCSKISPGCQNCYAEKMAGRLASMKMTQYSEVVHHGQDGSPISMWNGTTALVESALSKPIRWKKPRVIGVCFMGDLFHESVPFEWIDQVFAMMALCPQHTFLVLTKRPKSMMEYFIVSMEDKNIRPPLFISHDPAEGPELYSIGRKPAGIIVNKCFKRLGSIHPLPNVFLGVSAENQEQADKRIPILLQIPAAKRFVSVEPMLGPVDLQSHYWTASYAQWLDWVVCGGESGPGARPMNPEWTRSLRDQCRAAGVPFWFKQWGEWTPQSQAPSEIHLGVFRSMSLPGIVSSDTSFFRVGKKTAGHLLDGESIQEFPGA